MLRLWSLQPWCAWERLRDGLPFTTDPAVVQADDLFEPVFGRAYEWMAGKLAAKTPPPDPGSWLVWGWHTYDPRWPGRPDLRRLRPLEPGVLLELLVPSSQVLLSRFEAWHIVINDWYAGRDYRRFEQQLVTRGIGHGDWDAAADVRAQVVQSWDVCLRVNPRREPVQAVTWAIRPEHVQRHWRYKGWPVAPAPNTTAH